jgi:hypothetical protein
VHGCDTLSVFLSVCADFMIVGKNSARRGDSPGRGIDPPRYGFLRAGSFLSCLVLGVVVARGARPERRCKLTGAVIRG